MSQRIQVNLSDEMIKRLEMYSKKIGVNRSALCAQFIGQGVMSYDKAYEAFDTLASKMVNEVEGK